MIPAFFRSCKMPYDCNRTDVACAAILLLFGLAFSAVLGNGLLRLVVAEYHWIMPQSVNILLSVVIGAGLLCCFINILFIFYWVIYHVKAWRYRRRHVVGSLNIQGE